MQDLDLNSQLAARLNSRNVQFIFTGDVISGKNRCSIGDLADCLFTCWRSDPVQCDKRLRSASSIFSALRPATTAGQPSGKDPEKNPALHHPAPWTATAATGTVSGTHRRGERTSGPAPPTTTTQADSAAAGAGEEAAATAASSERLAVGV
jgi:hypothetical protein